MVVCGACGGDEFQIFPMSKTKDAISLVVALHCVECGNNITADGNRIQPTAPGSDRVN